jgi:limonene-1,2-epoxide hydrolase
LRYLRHKHHRVEAIAYVKAMKTIISTAILLVLISCGTQSSNPETAVPPDFVTKYYSAYTGIPKAERLAPFYADSVVIDDPTYDWVGRGKVNIFKNFDRNNAINNYNWRVDQQIVKDNVLVTEGLLEAKYGDIPYAMRFVNIFHFENGKIIRQYDYFDNKDWYKAMEEWKSKNTP